MWKINGKIDKPTTDKRIFCKKNLPKTQGSQSKVHGIKYVYNIYSLIIIV